MVAFVRKLGWVKSTLLVVATILGIATSVWGLSENISASVSEKVEGTARRVIQEELQEYGAERDARRSTEIDERIRVHELEAEIKLNERLQILRDQNIEIQAQLRELLRRTEK